MDVESCAMPRGTQASGLDIWSIGRIANFDTRHTLNYKMPEEIYLQTFFFPNSYVPRKCSATNRIIKANDHASVQLSVGKVDENGRYTGENETYALCGFIRARGESDDSFNRLAQKDGYLKNVWSASRQR